MDVRRVRNTTHGNLKILPHRDVSSETASWRIAPSPNRPHSNRNKALRDHSSQRSVPYRDSLHITRIVSYCNVSRLFLPNRSDRDVIYLTLPYHAIPHGTVTSSTTVSYRDGLYRMYCTAVSHRNLTKIAYSSPNNTRVVRCRTVPNRTESLLLKLYT